MFGFVLMEQPLDRSFGSRHLEHMDWTTLIGIAIGPTITGIGILVATVNVTRQMRLSIRGRELDRLEREIPSLQAAIILVSRISEAIAIRPNAENLIRELSSRDLDKSGAALTAQVTEALPGTHDFTRRELAAELSKLGAAATQMRQQENALLEAESSLKFIQGLSRERYDPSVQEAELAQERIRHVAAREQFDRALKAFDDYRDSLIRQDASNGENYARLRRMQGRALGFES
jgi:hypothetical protein